MSAEACLIVVGCLGACSGPPEPLNVVVITLDTFRADALGAYGNAEGLSPHIDALAAEATVFDNTVTPIGTTGPSHASIFTGLYPRNHGVRWNGDGLEDGFTTLAEILAANGYETAAYVSMGALLSRGGLHQGFLYHSDSPDKPPSEFWRIGDEVNGLGLPWLDARSARPFFLWLHYYETHPPYRLSAYAKRQHASAGYDGALAQGAEVETVRSLGKEIPWTPAERAALRALYDGEVIEADRLVGEVIDALRERELLGRTIIVLTADHGEALGEHDDVGHGFVLWQPVLHVPLMIRVPGSPGPRRIDTRVSLIDLTPTILDLLGLAIPPGLNGRSLAAGLAGEPLAARRYFAEVRAVGNEQFQTVADSDRYAVFDGNLKGIWDRESFFVFDLERDPQELDGAIRQVDEPRRRELLGAVSAYRRGARQGETGKLSEELIEELRALGYIE